MTLVTTLSEAGCLKAEGKLIACRSTAVHVKVAGPAAYVEFEQTFESPSTAQGAVYTFPLPEQAVWHRCARQIEKRSGRRTERELAEVGTAALGEAERLTVPIGTLPAGQVVHLWTSYAQELAGWNRTLQLRVPLGTGVSPGELSLDVELVGQALEPAEVTVNCALQPVRGGPGPGRQRLRFRSDEAPDRDFILRLRTKEDWPRPLLLTHRGCFVLCLRPPRESPVGRHWDGDRVLSDLRLIDHGIGLYYGTQTGSTYRDRPLVLYGRHADDGELELEASWAGCREASWHALLKALPCDNPALPLLWARARIRELQAQAVSSRRNGDEIRELARPLTPCWAPFARKDKAAPTGSCVDALAIAVASFRRGLGSRAELDGRIEDVLAWLETEAVRRVKLIKEGRVLRTVLYQQARVVTRLERYVKVLRGLPPDCRCEQCVDPRGLACGFPNR